MDELKRLLKDFLGVAHPLLSQAFASHPSLKLEAVIAHGEGNSISTSFVAVPDYIEALIAARDSLVKIPELAQLLEYVKTNDALAADLLVDGDQPLPTDKPDSFFSLTVWPLLISYLQQVKALGDSVDEIVFARLFEELRSYLESPQVTFIYEAPLLGLETDLDRVDFSDDVWIRRRNDDDLKRVSSPYRQGVSDPMHNEIFVSTHFLVVRTHINKRAPLSNEQAVKVAENVLSAFRLYKSGAIGIGSSRHYPELDAGLQRGSLQSPSNPVYGPAYTLASPDVSDLLTLFSSISSSTDKRWLLALRRLNLTYARRLNEDRLIDGWVGLETLLLSDGNSGELRFKVGLRLARFLGATKDERLALKEDAMTSYNRRSDVVHGNNLKADMPQVTDKTVDLLRRVLVRWLDVDVPHDIKSIDDSMLA